MNESQLENSGAPPYDHHDLARLGPRPWGLLPREADSEELLTAVQTVHAGLLAIDPVIAAQLFAAAERAMPSLRSDIAAGKSYYC